MSESSSVGQSNKTEHVQRQYAPCCGDRRAELLLTYETGSTVLPYGRTGLQSRRHHQGCMHPSGRRQTGGQMHHATYTCHNVRSRQSRLACSAPAPSPSPLRGLWQRQFDQFREKYRSAPSLVPHTHTHTHTHTPTPTPTHTPTHPHTHTHTYCDFVVATCDNTFHVCSKLVDDFQDQP